MILSLLAFTLAAVALFLSSQALLSRLFRLLPLNLVFFLLLPGVFLHEFSHILMAELLRVPTGELKLKPELKEGHLALGSAQIAATDPFRLTLIGLAPFLTAAAILWLLIRFGLNLELARPLWPQLQQLINNIPVYRLLIAVYLLFSISNTMFSSASDLQAAAVPLVVILILAGAFYLLHLSLPTSAVGYTSQLLNSISLVFAATLTVNLTLLLLLKLLPFSANISYGHAQNS